MINSPVENINRRIEITRRNCIFRVSFQSIFSVKLLDCLLARDSPFQSGSETRLILCMRRSQAILAFFAGMGLWGAMIHFMMTCFKIERTRRRARVLTQIFEFSRLKQYPSLNSRNSLKLSSKVFIGLALRVCEQNLPDPTALRP